MNELANTPATTSTSVSSVIVVKKRPDRGMLRHLRRPSAMYSSSSTRYRPPIVYANDVSTPMYSGYASDTE